MRTLIGNGTVVTAEGAREADVLIEDERIVAVGRDASWTPDRIIDASGQLVIPGGVDVHTHLYLPLGWTDACDDFATGTRAAAFGGTTTVVDFAQSERGESLRTGVELWHRKAERSFLDYGLHVVIREVHDRALREMAELVEEGISSFKVFMAYPDRYMIDDDSLLRVLKRSAEVGGLTVVHAEDGPGIEALVRRFLAQGKTEPIWHARSRPPALEAEAVRTLFALAELAGWPAYVVHLSSLDALDEVRKARGRGVGALAETCPQYLYLSEQELLRPNFEGARFVCSPPLRSGSHQGALWEGLSDGSLQVVATDHAPFNTAQRERGRGDFSRIPGGLPAIEDRLTLLYQGVTQGRLTLTRFVDLVSTTPARLFGLAPRKGTIAPGSDADVVVFDPEASRVISATTHHMNVDYSAFEGMAVRGIPRVVMQRGRILVQGAEFNGTEGQGTFLTRRPFDPPGA